MNKREHAVMKWATAVSALALNAALLSTNAMAQTAHIQADVQPHGNPVSSFETTYTPENSNYFYVSELRQLAADKDAVSALWLTLGTGNTPYALIIVSTTMLNEPLKVGHYENVQRGPFEEAGHAGFYVGYQGSGNNEMWGSFDILDISFLPDGKLGALSMTFDMAGSSSYGVDVSTWDTVKGSFSYQAAGVVPEPGAAALFGFGALMLGFAVRRKP